MNKRVTYFNNEKNISGRLIQDLRKKFNLSVEDLAIKLQLEGIDISAQVIRNNEEEIKYIDSAMLL